MRGINPDKKIYDLEKAREKIQAYCAYQERSHRQVEEKLQGFGLFEEARDQLLLELIQGNFLSESRFAEQYARGKMRQSKWGRYKILQGLRQHRIHKSLAQKVIAALDPDEYLNVLREVAEKKWSSTTASKNYLRKAKVQRYLQQRGFESDLIRDVLLDLEAEV